MKLYLDHNVYARIAERGETEDVARWLATDGSSILASDITVLEALRIKADGERAARIATIVRLSPAFPMPLAFLDAREVRHEIRRVRPGWLRDRPLTADVDVHLNDHRRQWRELKRDPSFMPPSFAQVERVLGPTVGIVRDTHRRSRAARQRGALGERQTDSTAAILEAHWREESMQVWYGALFERNPSMRDYWDYLAPYLRPIEIDESDWFRLWQRDIAGENVPRIRAAALAGYFQARHPVSAGNALDTLHAVGLLDADVFFTADRAFHATLCDLRPWLPTAGLPVLVEPTAPMLPQLMSAVTGRS